MLGVKDKLTSMVPSGVKSSISDVTTTVSNIASSASSGNETRASILPTIDIRSSGFMPPDYDFSANLPTPYDIGVRRDDTLGSVIQAVKGVAYYADMIGFGQSTNPLTRDMPVRPLGINYFIKTGLTCTNGQPMYQYVNGIPDGTALGRSVKRALEQLGVPGLRGLAPGMIEDVKAALDPSPILTAALGNPYPVCKKVTLPVGDSEGKLRDPNPEINTVWISDPVQMINGIPHQTRWVQETVNGSGKFVSRDEAEATPKVTEGFEDVEQRLASLGVAFALLGGLLIYKKIA